MRQLRYLDASSNDLTSIPGGAGYVTATSIRESLPPVCCLAELRQLRNLQKLYLVGNKISFVSPDGFQMCKKLMEVNLSSNKLEELPVSLCDLPVLSHLDVSWNSLLSLPAEVTDIFSMSLCCLPTL